MFSSVGGYGITMRCACVAVSPILLTSLSGFCFIGYGNDGDRIPTSVQPCLLKYTLSTLLHTNNGSFVCFWPILNCIGIHPWQDRIDPPTALTCFWHGIRSPVESDSLAMCWGPARHMLAPLSGNICKLFGLNSLDGLVSLPRVSQICLSLLTLW